MKAASLFSKSGMSMEQTLADIHPNQWCCKAAALPSMASKPARVGICRKI